MKKTAMVLVLVLALTTVFASAALADNPGNGVPAAHGVDGKTFGQAVSGLAKSYPGAVADHVSSGRGDSMAGGMPAAHGVDGKTFGAAVSGLAKSYPGAVGDHASGR